MTEFWKRLRYKIAYWCASDWINDLEYRLSGLLCEVTGSRLSKSYYTLDAMVSAVHDYNEDCARYIEIGAIRDFAERLKARVKEAVYEQPDGGHVCESEIDGIINELVAEMEG